MKDLKTCTEEMKFDVRLLTKNKRAGIFTDEEYQIYLDGLVDVENQATDVNLNEPKETAAMEDLTETPAVPSY